MSWNQLESSFPIEPFWAVFDLTQTANNCLQSATNKAFRSFLKNVHVGSACNLSGELQKEFPVTRISATTIASFACFVCLFVAIFCWPPKLMSGICLLSSSIPNMSSYLVVIVCKNWVFKLIAQEIGTCMRCSYMSDGNAKSILARCQALYWLNGKLSCQALQMVPEKLTTNLIAHVMESFLSLS